MVEVARITTDRMLDIIGELDERLPAITNGLKMHFPFDGSPNGIVVPDIHKDLDTIWNDGNIVTGQLHPVNNSGVHDIVVMEADVFITQAPSERYTILQTNVGSQAMYLSIDSNMKVSCYNYQKVAPGYYASNAKLELKRWYTITHINSKTHTIIMIDGVVDRVIANNNNAPTTIASLYIGAENSGRRLKGEIKNIKVSSGNPVPLTNTDCTHTDEGMFIDMPTENIVPLTKNRFFTNGNSHGTYNTNQYRGDAGANTDFDIGVVESVVDNIVTLSEVRHKIYDYDVLHASTTGGGVTAGTQYFIKKHAENKFSLHAYNASQDGSQGYIVDGKGFKVHESMWADQRIAINATDFPTRWHGNAHQPNSGLVKEIIPNGFKGIHDCIRLHKQHKDDPTYYGTNDHMAYGVYPPVTAGEVYTISFWYRAVTPESLEGGTKYLQHTFHTAAGWAGQGKRVYMKDYEWHYYEQTLTAPNTGGTNMYWGQSKGTTIDIACLHFEHKGHKSYFEDGSRGIGTFEIECDAFRKGDYTLNAFLKPNTKWKDSTTSNQATAETFRENFFTWGVPGTNGFMIRVMREAKEIQCTFFGPSSTISYVYDTDAEFDNWNEIMITMTVSGTSMKFYINGKYIGGGTVGTKPTDDKLRFHRDGSYEGRVGRYRDVSIYNRALTLEEIFDIYQTKYAIQSTGDVLSGYTYEKPILPKDVNYFPLYDDADDEFGAIVPVKEDVLTFEEGSIYIGKGIDNMSYNKMDNYTPYFTMNEQKGGNLKLTAVNDNTYIALRVSGFTPLSTDVMTISGIMKLNGKPHWINSSRLNTYNATNPNMWFDEETGEFLVIETQTGAVQWLFHAQVLCKAGDILTIERLQITKTKHEVPFQLGSISGVSALDYNPEKLITLDEGTIGIMFKPTERFFTETSWSRVFGHSTSVNRNEIQVKKNNTSKKLCMSISDNAGSVQTSWNSLTTDFDLEKDKWYLVIARWSKSQGIMKLTVNDKTYEQVLTDARVPTVYGVLTVGSHAQYDRHSFSYFKDLFTAKRMMTDEEVKFIYHNKIGHDNKYLQIPHELREKEVLS